MAPLKETDRFLRFVEQIRPGVREVSPREAAAKVERGAVIIDVRERDEYRRVHIPQALHLSRGLLELEIEVRVPDLATPLICICSGGARSILAAEALQRMGYRNVESVAGGMSAWEKEGLAVEYRYLLMED